jgi:hypothetical protein
MNNVSKSEQDKFVLVVRLTEKLMKEELLARKRRYFTAENLVRELRHNINV